MAMTWGSVLHLVLVALAAFWVSHRRLKRNRAQMKGSSGPGMKQG